MHLLAVQKNPKNIFPEEFVLKLVAACIEDQKLWLPNEPPSSLFEQQ